MPVVSIVLPTFNRLGFLRSAVDSAFAQTLTDWEMIIADDGSTGEARTYLESIAGVRARVLWLSHSGNPARVRNVAIREARGQYLAFLDSDDVWAPRKLQMQIEALRSRPDRGWCYTHSDCIDEKGDPFLDVQYRFPGDGWILEPLLKDVGLQIAMPTLMAERELVLKLGCFDEQQQFCEDHDLCLRLAMRSQVAVVPERLCSIRTHREHYSADRIGEYVNRLRLYGKMHAVIDDPRLKAICRRVAAEQSLVLAGFHGDKGDISALWRTLASASTFSWPYPYWWLGVLKTAVRPTIPRQMLSFYRGRRRRPPISSTLGK